MWATGLNKTGLLLPLRSPARQLQPFCLELYERGHCLLQLCHHSFAPPCLGSSPRRFGYGLGHTLHLYQDKFRGVLNGIDNDVWNPESDRYIPHHYTKEDLEGKAKTKKALRERLLLRDVDKPIIAFIGRLDDQKGVHLVHHAIYYSLE